MAANLFDLTGKTALITGSSRGIGRAIAEAMAAAGARVVISSRKQEACAAVAEAINAAHGAGTAIPISASISDGNALAALVDQTRACLGPIDILVCNAASSPYYGAWLDMSDDVFRKTIENNMMATHRLIRLAAPDMIERRDGAIILISSIVAYVGTAMLGPYAVTKAANLQMVRNLAVELGAHNIRVNAIAPGPIRTDFARAFHEDPAVEAQMAGATAIGRIGEPVDVAGAALFFASAAGRFVTGQSLVVDGGTLIKGSP